MRATLLPFLVAAAQAMIVTGPSGPYPVAHKVVPLADESRWDPYAPEDKPHKRGVLTSVFYPVNVEQDACQVETVDYLPPKTLETYGQVLESMGLPAALLEGYKMEFCKAEPMDTQEQYPVVVFSPGFSNSRLLSGVEARSLASQGNVVITMDHPYEASIVEFPDGSVVRGLNISSTDPGAIEETLKVRTGDVSFLIDQLENPKPLGIDALASRINASSVFAYGHSRGGNTAALAAYQDDRIVGGLDLDGGVHGAVAEAGLDKPFIVVGRSVENNDTNPFDDFLDKLRGPKMLLNVADTVHLSFCDLPLLFAARHDIPPEMKPVVDGFVGAIDGRRVAKVLDGVLGAMVAFLFEGNAKGLFGIGKQFDEVTVTDKELRGLCRR